MLKKKSASLTINKPTPIFKPLCTANVWLPWYVPSDIISLNHKDIDDTNSSKAEPNITSTKGKACMVKTPEQVTVKREIQVNIGQGEGDTRWKG